MERERRFYNMVEIHFGEHHNEKFEPKVVEKRCRFIALDDHTSSKNVQGDYLHGVF